MANYSTFDYFTEQIRTINLIIDSPCQSTSIMREFSPLADTEYWWYANDGKDTIDRIVREFDWISDTYS